MSWQCRNCETFNDDSVDACYVCDALRERITVLEEIKTKALPPKVTNSKIIPSSKKTPHWIPTVYLSILVIGIGLLIFSASKSNVQGISTISMSQTNTPSVTIQPTSKNIENTKILIPSARPSNTLEPTSTKTLKPTKTDIPETDTPSPTMTPFGGGTGEISLVSKDKGKAAIYVVNINNSSSRLLTPLDSENWSPSWSPDGRFVAFESNRDTTWDIYRMDAHGFNVRRLTSGIGQNWFPAWSPDAKQIAFQSDRTGNWQIWVMSTYGTGLQQLTSNSGQNGYPSWSPDSEQIAFQCDQSGNWEIYVMDANGSNPHGLTTTGSNNQSPNWSPDGKEIAFQSDRSGSWEIHIMDTSGFNDRDITSDGKQNEVPVWSPDGKHIAFQSGLGATKTFSIIDPDGSNLISLNTYNGVPDGILAWVP